MAIKSALPHHSEAICQYTVTCTSSSSVNTANICSSPSPCRLCATYPKLFVVPSSLSEEDIRSAAKFRALGRVPAIVWRCVLVYMYMYMYIV